MVANSLIRAAIAVFLWLLTLVWSTPVLWLSILSLRTTEEFYRDPFALPNPAHWDKFRAAWFDFGYSQYFMNSAIVSTLGSTILLIVGSMAAYYFARYTFKYKEVLYMGIFSSIMLPPQITILALFQMLAQYNLYDSLVGLSLVYAASHLPLTLYLLRLAFEQVPLELEEAARIDGAGPWTVFRLIMLPVVSPAILVITVINFIDFWNEFLYAVVLISSQEQRTLPLAVMFFLGEQYENVGMLATGLVISTLPIVVLYVLFSERIARNLTAGALAGS